MADGTRPTGDRYRGIEDLNIVNSCDLLKKRTLKGTEFSPSVNKKSRLAAQPQGLKPSLFLQLLAARLKSCPDTKTPAMRDFPQPTTRKRNRSRRSASS